ncbi:MAG: glutamate--tRNA ligase [Opitutales bacterium]
MSPVRVRFAPSPTGNLHLGSARTALFNWLFARHTDGTFVLRIEDTDRERNTPESLATVLDGLRWMGLDWDEGPNVGGDWGPYFQSERGAIYEAHLQKLLDAGRAYKQDGAIFFRLEGERYTEFDKFKQADVEKVKADPVLIADAVRGNVKHHVESDFVLRRATGDFGFHFTNVVDDLTMAITHVIRGEDHLTNTARHIRLFEALGAAPPVYAHLPLILKSDGRGKMSKREPGGGLNEHIEGGILPAAFVNFLALLGWNPKDDREKLSVGELIERFDLPGINKDGARFDPKKLAALNTDYLRELPLETFAWHAGPVLAKAGLIDDATDEDLLQKVLALVQPKVRDLPGLPALCGFFFSQAFETDEKALSKVTKKGDPAERARLVIPALETVSADQWTAEALDAAFDELARQTEAAKFDYFPVTRLAISGQGGGPDLLGCLEVLGREKVLERLRRFAG